MFTVYKEKFFSAAHQVLEPDGNLEPLHGHNWRVKVFVSAERLDDRGMVVDFLLLDRILEEVLKPYSGRYLNEIAPFQDMIPTAEHFARFLFQEVGRKVNDGRAKVCRVELWETHDACAIYEVK